MIATKINGAFCFHIFDQLSTKYCFNGPHNYHAVCGHYHENITQACHRVHFQRACIVLVHTGVSYITGTFPGRVDNVMTMICVRDSI